MSGQTETRSKEPFQIDAKHQDGTLESLLKKRRVRVSVAAILAIAIPLFLVLLAIAAFLVLGLRLQNNMQIFPTITIDGINVSWLTKQEAAQALNLQTYDARGENTEVIVTFPDGNELRIAGRDVGFTHDAAFLIDSAFSVGRGNGFINDATSFIERMYDFYVNNGYGIYESYTVRHSFDVGLLQAHVSAFTDNFNAQLDAATPIVSDDRVEIVKGVGQVNANALEIGELVFEGLFTSLATGGPVQITYNLPEADADMEGLMTIFDDVHITPLNAWYDPETYEVTDGVEGLGFCIDSVVAMLNEVGSGQSVVFDLEVLYPEITREYLEEYIRNIPFRDLIGETITYVAGTANRLGNVILACAAVDGYVLEPGEEFSFNQTLGRRTYERGYRSAPAFSGGQTVQAIGGGICQVSSSIYNAIMDSDILITERRPHGQPVAYLPRGRDATVSWGTIDFRFVNNTEHPIRISAEVDNRTLTVQVFGTIN